MPDIVSSAGSTLLSAWYCQLNLKTLHVEYLLGPKSLCLFLWEVPGQWLLFSNLSNPLEVCKALKTKQVALAGQEMVF
jgi:hypothetical protein